MTLYSAVRTAHSASYPVKRCSLFCRRKCWFGSARAAQIPVEDESFL